MSIEFLFHIFLISTPEENRTLIIGFGDRYVTITPQTHLWVGSVAHLPTETINLK
jgi:hypothetical protein